MLTSDLSLRVIDFGRAAPPASLQPPDPEATPPHEPSRAPPSCRLAHQYQPLGERANSTAAAYKVEMLYHCCGSRSYCAPEVLSQAGYAFGADVWSCGVALFAMLLGFFPLEEASHADWRYDKLKRAQQDGKCTVSTVLQWYGKQHRLTDEALNLLDGMLAIDQAERLSPAAILQHAWFDSAAPQRAARSPAYRTRGRAAPAEESDTIVPGEKGGAGQTWVGYGAGTAARLLTSLTGVDFKAGGMGAKGGDGKRKPVYRAAEVDAMLSEVLAEGCDIAAPPMRRNANFGAGAIIPTLPSGPAAFAF
mmetsp:Transcript_16278/g.49057  ORF Transcript_16278/g.49057 Transcript_16278/m.49057 type:complete len:306 (+) Transcript_16278:1023-1940(+)